MRRAPGLATAALLVLAAALPAAAGTISGGPPLAANVNFAGTLVDRQCSLPDALGAQVAADRRCTLWVQDSTGRVVTAYCPNQRSIGGITYSSYVTCSDPYAAQISRPVTLGGHLRSPAEASDGLGEFIVTQVQF